MSHTVLQSIYCYWKVVFIALSCWFPLRSLVFVTSSIMVPLLTSFPSSDMPLSTGHEPFDLFLIFNTSSYTIIASIRSKVDLSFLFQAQGRESWTSMWIFVSHSILPFLYRFLSSLCCHGIQLQTKDMYPGIWTGEVILLKEHNGIQQPCTRNNKWFMGESFFPQV